MADSLNVSGSVNMPFNLEAEQSVLGSILIKPECIEEVIEHVNAESFYLPQHNAIFSSMIFCSLRNQFRQLQMLYIMLKS